MIPYSPQFKSRMVQKLVGPNAMSATALSAEVGIAQGTLSRWLKRAATIPLSMTADDAPKAHEWTPEQKVAFVLEAAAVPSAELGGFLRRKGVLEAQLDAWRKQVTEGAVASMRPPSRRDREAAAAEAMRYQEKMIFIEGPQRKTARAPASRWASRSIRSVRVPRRGDDARNSR